MRRPKSTNFYVYYRVGADSPSARARIRALLSDVETRTGVRGALSARSDDPTTWMESYPSVSRAASFRRTLATLAAKHDALAFTADGKRHVEEFSPLPPLATRSKGRK